MHILVRFQAKLVTNFQHMNMFGHDASVMLLGYVTNCHVHRNT